MRTTRELLRHPYNSHMSTNFHTQVLAIGFLLVILSSALYKNYLTLLVVATYILAPIPNFICGRCANPDDFIDNSGGNAAVDFGRFLTGFLVVMGVGKLMIWCDELLFCHAWLAVRSNKIRQSSSGKSLRDLHTSGQVQRLRRYISHTDHSLTC